MRGEAGSVGWPLCCSKFWEDEDAAGDGARNTPPNEGPADPAEVALDGRAFPLSLRRDEIGGGAYS